MAELWRHEAFRFYFMLAGCVALMYLPVVGRYVRMLATMVHEGGHVLVALLLGEKPQKVELFSDTSGVALVAYSSKWKAVLVSLAGYLFTPCMAFVSFWMLQRGWQVPYLWIVLLLSLLFLLCYIRNGFGIFWCLCFVLLHGWLLYRDHPFWIDGIARLDAGVLFVDAVCSCLILLRVAFRNPKRSGDAANIARFTHLPPLFTALAFTAFALYMDYLCVIHFFPKWS